MTLTNKTSAVLQDAGIDVYGGKAAEEQASLLRMQKFMSDHAGEVLTNIAAARTSKGDTGFATEVNTAAQEAGQWLQGVLKVAWSTATDQLPRINKLVEGNITTLGRARNPSEMVTQAACAADTATSIAAQTSLYAEIVQAGTDCDVSNKTLFNIEDCESSALSVQTGVSKVIMKGARTDDVWAKVDMAAATRDLLQAYTATIVLKDSCQSSDPIALAVCESEAFTLCSKLGVAAGYMHKSGELSLLRARFDLRLDAAHANGTERRASDGLRGVRLQVEQVNELTTAAARWPPTETGASLRQSTHGGQLCRAALLAPRDDAKPAKQAQRDAVRRSASCKLRCRPRRARCIGGGRSGGLTPDP
eukprot:g24513.t1